MANDRPINGEGPEPCDLMLVGSEPYWKDARAGHVFTGPVGEEVDRLLFAAGSRRSRWFTTNVFRHFQHKDAGPRPSEHYEYAYHTLKDELTRVQPRLILPLGREAIRFFLGDVDVDEVWGLHLRPDDDVFRRLPMLRPDVTFAPQVHPAAGFHSPESSSQVLVGFRQLAGILRGTTPARGLLDDPCPNPDYHTVDTADALTAWTAGVTETGADTEGYPHAPWSLQVSATAGEGLLLRSPAVVAAAASWLRQERPNVVFHAALHDLRVLRSMGMDLIEDGVPFEDTQLMAYLLGVIPQGLKPLAVRELAMPMLGYQEVLGDAQNRHARTYLQWLWDEVAAEHRARQEEDFEFQTKRLGRRIKKLPSHPKSNLQKAVERCLGSKDPARLWGDQVIDLHVEAHGRLGEMPEASLSDVNPDVALRYAARDPDATLRLANVLRPRLTELKLDDVYRLDLGTYPMLDRMMRVGVLPDPDAFRALGVVLDGELAVLLASLRTVTGNASFNPNSGPQTSDYLFTTLGLEVLGRQTQDGGGSTNDKVLEALQRMYPEYPQIEDIRTYRELFKLRWTFVERLPELTKRWPNDERLHCELMLTRTPSGRLASKSPNLLAMPKHGKFAKAFRRCFVAGEGHLLLSADESQIEMRGLAHLSQDKELLAIFRGERRNPDGSLIDMHAATAQRIFGVAPKDQDESKHRLPAKAYNFGLPMGMTNIGLCLELRKNGLDVDEDEAQRWIDEGDKIYSGVTAYKAAMVREAERNGYVRCLSGRIRYIGGIRSKDERVRAEAARFAFSTPIQESAQFVGKQVLATAWKDIFCPLRRAGHWIEPLLWIHDDLLSEMEADLVLTVAPHLQHIMTNPPKGFSVPLKTAPEAGLNWADMVKV